jgi:Protein of unknown function (DUF3225)
MLALSAISYLLRCMSPLLAPTDESLYANVQHIPLIPVPAFAEAGSSGDPAGCPLARARAGRHKHAIDMASKEHPMEIDLPDVVAEVRAAFDRYETALVTNDVPMLDELFRDDPRTIRYGATEILYGYDEIKSFRAARSPVALGRRISRTVITTFGRDFAVASTLYERPTAPGKIGRQTQTWVKFPEGWRVVVGHVSLMDKPAAG